VSLDGLTKKNKKKRKKKNPLCEKKKRVKIGTHYLRK